MGANFIEILRKSHSVILEKWIDSQSNIMTYNDDLISSQEIREQAEELLSAFLKNLNVDNAKFYAAVCALELGNGDAEALFQNFIKDYPLNPNTKLAYFHVGKSYFDQKEYQKALEWFEKTDPSTLSAKQRLEYQFKQGYAYFQLNDIERAEPLFEAVKKEDSPFQESATYYFAYINYLNKEYKTALANFEKLRGSPTYESSYPYYITSMYYLDERYDDVISYAVPILKSTKQEYETEMLSLIAASYFAKNDYKNAEIYFRDFYAKNTNGVQNNLFIYQYGYTLYKLKKSKVLASLIRLDFGNCFRKLWVDSIA